VFVEKIRRLEGVYSSIRRTRGDGNCFFRSFIFAYLEALIGDRDIGERNRCACGHACQRPRMR
jgi:ubiquitin thioesterase protein OTUB1